jgi:hypothetical protein
MVIECFDIVFERFLPVFALSILPNHRILTPPHSFLPEKSTSSQKNLKKLKNLNFPHNFTLSPLSSYALMTYALFP